MPKLLVLKKWREVGATYFEDGPPKRVDYTATLFVNRCELRRRANGVRYLIRSNGIEHLVAGTKRNLMRAIKKFVEQEDVRLLADGIETNDWDGLPSRVEDPDQSVIDGRSDIYQEV